MKRVLKCVAFLMFFLLTGCYQYIDSGNVGVRVSLSGTDKGVDPKPIGVGRAWYNPITEDIYEFPVYEQNVLWAGPNPTKGRTEDESITISSSQSAQINVDVGMTYEILDDMVPTLFGKLRKDIDYISHQWMRNHVKEVLGRKASHMDTMQILSEGREKLLDETKEALNEDLKEYGINVKLLTFSSSPRPEQKIQDSIDATITAKQLAIQAENKVAQSKAEADQEIEKARGRAQSVIVEAEANLKKSELEAQGNLVLSKSITPELIRYQQALRWDGILPKITGGVTPMIDFGSLTNKD